MSLMKKSTCSTYNAAPYFRYYVKHNLYQLALFIVVIILAVILPCCMEYGRISDNRYNQVLDLTEYGKIGFLLSGCMGLFGGMTALSYVNSKQNITCMHSFPLKRTSLFFCEIPAGPIYYLISITIAFSAILMMSGFEKCELNKGVFAAMYLASIALFVLIHSAVLLSAGLSGTGVSRFFTAMLLLFMPFVLYALVIYTCAVGNNSIDISYYLSEKVCSFLCPVYRLLNAVFNYDSGKTIAAEVVKTVPCTVLAYAGAALLHKYRRTEDTSKSIIWKPVFWVVKYSVMFCGSMLGIILFGSGLIFLSSGVTDKIIGAMIGLIASFIFVNCILYRSVRALFKDWKPSLIFAAAVLLYTLAVPSNIFGVVGRLYSDGNTRTFDIIADKIKVSVSDEEYDEISKYMNSGNSSNTYSDEIYISDIWSENDADYIRDNFSEYADNTISDDINDDTSVSTVVSRSTVTYVGIKLVQYPVFGFPKAYEISIPTSSELWRKIVSSEEYSSEMDISDYGEDGHYETIQLVIGNKTVTFSADGECNTINSDYTYEICRSLDDNEKNERDELIKRLTDSAVFDADMLAVNSILGYAEINTGYTADYTMKHILFPISAGNIDMINAALDLLAFAEKKDRSSEFSSVEEYFDYAASEYTYAVMINLKTGEAKRISTDTLSKCAKYTSALGGFEWDYYKYTSIDESGYVLLVKDSNGCSTELYFRDDAQAAVNTAELFETAELFNTAD